MRIQTLSVRNLLPRMALILTAVSPFLAQTALGSVASTSASGSSCFGDTCGYVFDKRELTEADALKINSLLSKGPAGTGGGDKYVLDFLSTAVQEVYPMINESWSKQVPGLTGDAFLAAIDPTSIASIPKVYESCEENSARGREVEACYNARTNKYFISREKYELNQSSLAKTKLVAHEVFRKMKIEGDGYEVTSQLFVPKAIKLPDTTSEKARTAQMIPREVIKATASANLKPADFSNSQNAYSALANSLRKSATQRTDAGLETLKSVNESIAEWVKGKFKESRDGVVKIDLGSAQESGAYKTSGFWSNQSSSYSEDNTSFQTAYTKALNMSLSSTGMGVLSVGVKHQDGSNAVGKVLNAFNSTYSASRAYAFIGPVPGAEAKLAEYSFKLMTFADGLAMMGRVYNEALANLEAEFQADLKTRGVKLSAAEYMAQLRELHKNANLELSVTMFRDKDAESLFMEDLSKSMASAQAHANAAKIRIENLPTPIPPATSRPDVNNGKVWTCRFVNEYKPRPAVDFSLDAATAKARQNCISAQTSGYVNACHEDDVVCTQ